MSTMTEKMSEAGSGQPLTKDGMSTPKRGERFRCQTCGMEIQITADCRCNDPYDVHFQCCGQELQKKA